MRFKFSTKIVLYVMLTVVLITLLKNMRHKQRRNRFLGNYSHFQEKDPSMKYILLWTKEENIPFAYIGKGRRGFIDRKCPYTNCVVSGNESLLGSTTAFDVILFAGPELVTFDNSMLPAERLRYQKYVFASIEAPEYYPLCFHDFDGYFNWTWTFKLESDLRWGYIVIRDIHNKIVGPKKDMHWIHWSDMNPVSDKFKQQLKSKTKAVAWFVSNCRTRSRREGFVKNLKKELNKYDLDVDVYGGCGSFVCPHDEQDRCNKLISTDYYFYLSFENVFSDDYVTEKLLHPLKNNAVPIVYGGANYTRFMPNGAYLNARELGIYKLAKKIKDLMEDHESYANFFKWKNHYTYHKMSDAVETNEYCNMCALLNDEESMKKTSVIENFNEFWEVYNTC